MRNDVEGVRNDEGLACTQWRGAGRMTKSRARVRDPYYCA